jgi:ABC-2 type transport system ATP-binding protein
VAREVRVSTSPGVAPADVAAALRLPSTAVTAEHDGTLVLHVEPTPALVGALASWLAAEGVLLTELRAGSRSLEQAFLQVIGDR